MSALRWTPGGQRLGFGAFFLTLCVVAAAGLGPRMATTEKLLPHGYCFLWDPPLLRLHIVADSLIGIAYIAIPIALVKFIRLRTDLPFNWMFLLFGVFIVACGASHIAEIWTFWSPDYWLLGGIKAITAAASVPTAVLLFRLIPDALALPSTRQLREAKEALEREVVERRKVEAALRDAQAELESRVAERTRDLQAANEHLEANRKELETNARRKTEFLAILSHELRNPIHAIQTNAAYLNAVETSEDAREAVGAIERQVLQMSRLLSDLLNVVHEDDRPLELHRTPQDVREAARHAVADVHGLLRERGQEVDLELPAEPVTANIDRTRVVQALTNVIRNAAVYSPPQSRIAIKVRADEREVAITVADQGIGLDASEKAALFELFSRGERARHQSAQGLGIGLFVVRQVAEAHGGRISADSEGPGRGTAFTIVLPR